MHSKLNEATCALLLCNNLPTSQCLGLIIAVKLITAKSKVHTRHALLRKVVPRCELWDSNYTVLFVIFQTAMARQKCCASEQFEFYSTQFKLL